MALHGLRKATSETVSKRTVRARALDSSYLSQLVNMGILRKKRQEKEVYFYNQERIF